MIQALMEPERDKLKRKEREVESLHHQTKVWRGLRQGLTDLREYSKNLYSFNNPFTDKLADSSDVSVLTATAARDAEIGERTVIVKRIAQGDKFISDSLPRDFRVKSGMYVFLIGEREIRFRFGGGTLRELAEAINRKSGGLLRADVVADTSQTLVFVIESKETGTENRLVFREQALEFGFETGILEAAGGQRLEVSIDPATSVSWELPDDPAAYEISDGRLTLGAASGETRIPVVPSFSPDNEMVLEMQIEMRVLDDEAWVPPPPPPGPSLSPPGSAEFDGLIVENEKSEFVEPEIEQHKPPERVEDLRIVSVVSGERTVELPDIRPSEGEQKLRYPVGENLDRIDAIVLTNRNTHREIVVSDIRVYDPEARGDHRPVHPISEAQDALLILDGVEVERDTNDIEDLIPGVTLHLQSESDDPVDLSVGRDIEKVKEGIIAFVGHYNRMLTQIDILSRNDSDVIEDAVFLSEQEREEAERNLGLFQGENGLSLLKRKLRTVMLSPYKTSRGRELTLLAQMGISTDVSNPGMKSTLEKSKLRGYLEIDENQMEEAIETYPEAVRELFGYDTDGDLVVDSGVAYATDAQLNSYVSTGGFIATKIATLDTTVDRRKRDISDFNRHLASYELSLRRKYGRMESALQSFEQSSKAIENFRSKNEN